MNSHQINITEQLDINLKSSVHSINNPGKMIIQEIKPCSTFTVNGHSWENISIMPIL